MGTSHGLAVQITPGVWQGCNSDKVFRKIAAASANLPKVTSLLMLSLNPGNTDG